MEENRTCTMPVITDERQRYDRFTNGEVLYGRKGKLPPMGWNSWNAFGSGNTEALTRAMVDKILELGLDKLGYEYVVLDDGCYKPERVNGRLVNDEVKFPNGFKALADHIHGKGLKFGLYNDIGSKLCSGAEVGIRGYEQVDTKDYTDWGIDFIKVDNCYNVWDNATFSKPENARFTFAPNIKAIAVKGHGSDMEMTAVSSGRITGKRAYVTDGYVTGIGTFDGTGPDASPVDDLSSELIFEAKVPEAGDYDLTVLYATGQAEGVGEWLQLAVGCGDAAVYYYDDLLPATPSVQEFVLSDPIRIVLEKGRNMIRIMNHRRQENTLYSYALIRKYFEEADRNRDITFSICEWGKTHPHHWGYKVGDSWRILNDITFHVGSDGDPGKGSWEGAYTTSVTAQYNKAVIMDEYSGLDRGWNDPDMMMIGMDGLTTTMCRTHMTMWCMMNAPLMLGMDLRRVEKDDDICRIISNSEVIALNQDPLGVPAKRIYTTKAVEPDKTYLRDNDRIDVLAKPLADGSVALSFINVSMGDRYDRIEITADNICERIGNRMKDAAAFLNASSYEVRDLWSGEVKTVNVGVFSAEKLSACDQVTYRITPC